MENLKELDIKLTREQENEKFIELADSLMEESAKSPLMNYIRQKNKERRANENK